MILNVDFSKGQYKYVHNGSYCWDVLQQFIYTNNKITSYNGKHIISCTDKFTPLIHTTKCAMRISMHVVKTFYSAAM